jgi:serine protease
VISVPVGTEEAVVAEFIAQGIIAGLNRILYATMVPNDAYYSPYQWHLTRIQGEAVWDITTGSGVTVAVLDTGLATAGALDGIACIDANQYDVVNQDTDPDDGDGHGTHVSGTIAQTTNNLLGTAGMAHGACVLPVKVLDDGGSGSAADIAEGIVYAVDQGASVINMSLGYNAKWKITNDPIMDPALDYAHSQGVTVVCAAGNDSFDQNVSYPAIYPTTIAVGATDYADELTSYSNSGDGLDIVAPGGDTRADLNGDGYGDGILQETRSDGAWGFWFFQGTSMASPHVAAVATLVVAKHGAGTLTADEVYSVLTNSALDLGAAGFDSVYGHGLVQAADGVNGEPGTCTDADGDGWCVEEGDCDDTDPTINPDAEDSSKKKDADGIDNDCNGIIDG